jgi:2-amino-4-hydroxy-6-hydroxymethyldihydropteridine diphosphokinase
MCAVASTDVLRRAASGELPGWAAATPERREHIARVAALMDEWAAALGLGEAERERWRAAAWLHDSLRDADPEQLRAELDPEYADFPGPLLHGPAAAARLAAAVDAEVADAIRYHTLGHPRLSELGRALYLADFLEPGRDFAVEWREGLRGRMPGELPAVLIEVVAARIRHLLEQRNPIRPETAAFWSTLVREAR